MNPGDLAEFYYTQAGTSFRLGDTDKAIALVTKSIDLCEKQKYYVFRASCHTVAAHVEESISDANFAVKLSPSNPEAVYTRADANFYAGEFEWALVDF